jgi:hypothetical protein
MYTNGLYQWVVDSHTRVLVCPAGKAPGTKSGLMNLNCLNCRVNVVAPNRKGWGALCTTCAWPWEEGDEVPIQDTPV